MVRPFLFLALVWAGAVATPPEPVERTLVVIVHPMNPVEKMTLAELRRLYRAEWKHWPDGRHVVLAMRESYSKERSLILKAVYGMDEVHYRRFWLEKIFRGEADRPLTAMSAESMKEIVGRQKGAIGYLWEDQVDASVKVVLIDGQKSLAREREALPGGSGG